MKTPAHYLLVVGLGVTAAPAQASKSAEPASKHDGTPGTSLHVIGAVKTPNDFDLAALKALVARTPGPSMS